MTAIAEFIYCLFNETMNISAYTAPKGIMNEKLGRVSKEAVVA
jgi:hypothetical protein